MQAEVLLLDKNIARCAPPTRTTAGTSDHRVQRVRDREGVLDADLVIGAVLVPGAKAPK
jgi:alanine dehydrogenase